MRTAITFFVVSLSFAVVACSGEATEEGIETDTAGLDKSCVDKIQAKAGTKEWKDALDACVAAAKQDAGGSSSGKAGDATQGSSNGKKGCSVAVQCSSGACQCAAGPKKGAACDGKTTKDASSCSVVCAYDC